MSQLDEVRKKAERIGLAEPICNNCSWFDKPKSGDMGACRLRRGEQQFQFGICLNWTTGKTDLMQIRRDPNVVAGARPLCAGVEKPIDPPKPATVAPIHCAEPGCSGLLELRWSARLQRPFYGCSNYPACSGILPANEDGTPRGAPRTRELQGWRRKAHDAFDQIWKQQHATRPATYSWLRAATGLDHESAHMAKMGIEQCKMVLLVVETKGPGTEFWNQWKTEHATRKAQKKSRSRRSRKGSSPKRSSTR